jgi:hypothetical protein
VIVGWVSFDEHMKQLGLTFSDLPVTAEERPQAGQPLSLPTAEHVAKHTSRTRDRTKCPSRHKHPEHKPGHFCRCICVYCEP